MPTPAEVEFKIYPWFLDRIIDGRKRWDSRIDDLADDRIAALHMFDVHRRPEVKQITFRSNEDPAEFATVEYTGMEFAPWAPGWCFLQLGAVTSWKREGMAMSLEEIIDDAPVPV